MREFLTILASLIAVVGGLPYIIDTLKGKTEPNIVTWFTWSLFNGINVAAALSVGATQTALFSSAATLITASIAILGFKNGVKKYGPFDIVCQVLALIGIVLWQLTDRPLLAVAIVVLADFSGGLPTLRHAWKTPHEETRRTFIFAAISGALFLISLKQYSFVAFAFPLYIFLFDTTLVLVITLRSRLATSTASIKT